MRNHIKKVAQGTLRSSFAVVINPLVRALFDIPSINQNFVCQRKLLLDILISIENEFSRMRGSTGMAASL
jgi:hypothetical protein